MIKPQIRAEIRILVNELRQHFSKRLDYMHAGELWLAAREDDFIIKKQDRVFELKEKL